MNDPRHGGLRGQGGAYRRWNSLGALFGWSLLSGLAVAVLLPFVVYSALNSDANGLPSQQNAVIGTTAALIGGFYIFRSFVNFPGVRGGSYILPSFVASYGSVLAIFFFLRLDYSRFQFLTSSVLAILHYYAQFFLLRRRRRSIIGIVPGGEVDRLRTIDFIDWQPLDPVPHAALGCDSIVADLRADMPDEWERFIADCAIAGIPVFHYKQVQESLTGAVQIEHLSENNFGSLVPAFAYTRFKELLDVVAAACVGLLFSPILLAIGLAIRLDSPGPALFRQERMGFRGKPFIVYKFRTMRHGRAADDTRDDAITRASDLRVTRLGRFLRQSRIDELPQMINILRGEMSWIGPRPEAMVLSEWYEAELPFYRYRHIVRPGISGWAQVNQGHVAEVEDVLWKLHYDFYYIKYFSPWLDLLIVLRTIRTMLTGYGSR